MVFLPTYELAYILSLCTNLTKFSIPPVSFKIWFQPSKIMLRIPTTTTPPYLTWHHRDLKPDCSDPYLDSRLPWSCPSALPPSLAQNLKLCKVNLKMWHKSKYFSPDWTLHGLDFSLTKPLSRSPGKSGKMLNSFMSLMRSNQDCGQCHKEHKVIQQTMLHNWKIFIHCPLIFEYKCLHYYFSLRFSILLLRSLIFRTLKPLTFTTISQRMIQMILQEQHYNLPEDYFLNPALPHSEDL